MNMASNKPSINYYIFDGKLVMISRKAKGVKYGDEMKGLCCKCPLACYRHPMCRIPGEDHGFYKLCTLTVIATGELGLNEVMEKREDPVNRKNALALLKGMGYEPKPEETTQSALDFVTPYIVQVKTVTRRIKPTTSTIRQLSLFAEPAEPMPGDLGIRIKIAKHMENGLSLNEAKMLAGGFTLVRYKMDDKEIIFLAPDNMAGIWRPEQGSPYKTMAKAERHLKELLKCHDVIYVSPAGEILGGFESNRFKKLLQAGFDLYRSEGIITGHGTPRIKSASTNWGNWNKYSSAAEVKVAWEELMKNEKALEG